MATSNAIAAIGTQFQRGDGGTPESFTIVAEITAINGPGLSLEFLDITHMQSDDEYREVLPSFKDAGEISLDLNFVPSDSTQQDLMTDFNNRTKRNFKIIFPDAGNTTWSFSGYVTGYSISGSVGDKWSGSITIKVTGSISIT